MATELQPQQEPTGDVDRLQRVEGDRVEGVTMQERQLVVVDE